MMITTDDIQKYWPYYLEYFAEILNKTYGLDEAIEDLKSLKEQNPHE